MKSYFRSNRRNYVFKNRKRIMGNTLWTAGLNLENFRGSFEILLVDGVPRDTGRWIKIGRRPTLGVFPTGQNSSAGGGNHCRRRATHRQAQKTPYRPRLSEIKAPGEKRVERRTHQGLLDDGESNGEGVGLSGRQRL